VLTTIVTSDMVVSQRNLHIQKDRHHFGKAQTLHSSHEVVHAFSRCVCVSLF
jgi:hypothetical protein